MVSSTPPAVVADLFVRSNYLPFSQFSQFSQFPQFSQISQISRFDFGKFDPIRSYEFVYYYLNFFPLKFEFIFSILNFFSLLNLNFSPWIFSLEFEFFFLNLNFHFNLNFFPFNLSLFLKLEFVSLTFGFDIHFFVLFWLICRCEIPIISLDNFINVEFDFYYQFSHVKTIWFE